MLPSEIRTMRQVQAAFCRAFNLRFVYENSIISQFCRKFREQPSWRSFKQIILRIVLAQTFEIRFILANLASFVQSNSILLPIPSIKQIEPFQSEIGFLCSSFLPAFPNHWPSSGLPLSAWPTCSKRTCASTYRNREDNCSTSWMTQCEHDLWSFTFLYCAKWK